MATVFPISKMAKGEENKGEMDGRSPRARDLPPLPLPPPLLGGRACDLPPQPLPPPLLGGRARSSCLFTLSISNIKKKKTVYILNWMKVT